MSDLEVITFRPEPDQYAWMFGGAAPVKRIWSDRLFHR